MQLLKDSGYPGMKVLEFAFDPREETDYLPHSYDRNCVVYTGTHDNETLVQWYKGLDQESKDFAAEYMDSHPRRECCNTRRSRGNGLSAPRHRA